MNLQRVPSTATSHIEHETEAAAKSHSSGALLSASDDIIQAYTAAEANAAAEAKAAFLTPMPMFSEVSGDKTPLLMRKLKLCSVVFDFSEGSGLETEKEVHIAR